MNRLGEVARHLGIPVALAGDLGSPTNIYRAAHYHLHVTPVPGNSVPFSDIPEVRRDVRLYGIGDPQSCGKTVGTLSH